MTIIKVHTYVAGTKFLEIGKIFRTK